MTVFEFIVLFCEILAIAVNHQYQQFKLKRLQKQANI